MRTRRVLFRLLLALLGAFGAGCGGGDAPGAGSGAAAGDSDLAERSASADADAFSRRVVVYLEAGEPEIERTRASLSEEDFYVVADDLMYYRSAAYDYLERSGYPVERARRADRPRFLVGNRVVEVGVPDSAGLDALVAYEPGREPLVISPVDVHVLEEYFESAPGPGDAELLRRTERMVGFLRGAAPLDTLLLDDSVTLQVALEGGGATRRVARGELREPEEWRAGQHGFAPPARLTRLTTRVGSHLACMETELATAAPELAERPHVGARLEPPSPGSCLETWSATFVYTVNGSPPRLTAVVYDQWEW